MTATHTTNSTVSTAPVLYLALDLGTRDWKLAFTVGLGQNAQAQDDQRPQHLGACSGRSRPPRSDSVCPRMLRLSVATRQDATVSGCIASCWPRESRTRSSTPPASRSIAAREGPSRISLDAVKLVQMLIRWHNGERKVWSMVHVPTVEQEDQRQLHREMIKLKAERTAQGNSIKGLLAGLGLCVIVDETLPTQLAESPAMG